MTEKEKMLHGEWHDANFDDTLLAERRKAELLCYDFNMAKPGSVVTKDVPENCLVAGVPATIKKRINQ